MNNVVNRILQKAQLVKSLTKDDPFSSFKEFGSSFVLSMQVQQSDFLLDQFQYSL